MRVPGLIFASEQMLDIIGQDQAIEQVANVAFLPGIVKYSMAMPDIRWGVGFDINCGTRVIRTDMTEEEARPVLREVVNQVFRDIPAGLGGSGQVRVSGKEIDDGLVQGAQWAVAQGYGWPEDVEVIEGRGAL